MMLLHANIPIFQSSRYIISVLKGQNKWLLWKQSFWISKIGLENTEEKKGEAWSIRISFIIFMKIVLIANKRTCRYEFRLRVALSPEGELMLTSRVRNTNTDGKPFTFSFAYNSYFAISDIRFVIYKLCFASQDYIFIWFLLILT